MKKFLLLLCGLVAFSAQAQLITPIATARTLPNGTSVTVKGLVLNGQELGNIRYLRDATGALALFGNNVSTIQRGDTVQATGTVAPYNNLFELTPVSSFTILSSGNPLPSPAVLSIPAGFSELYEAHLVRFNNISFSGSGTFAGNTNYTITDGANTATVRIVNGSNLVGSPIPIGPIDLVGIMSQFCSTPPTGCTTGYQLLPRDLNDIMFSGNPPVLTTNLTQSNITTNGFTVSFTTQNNGNTIVRYGTSPNNLSQSSTDNLQSTSHSVTLTGLQPATIYYVQGLSVSATNDTSFSTVQAMATASLSTGVITVYFNRSVDHTVSTGVNAVHLNQVLDDTLIAYINRAEQTLDIAIYNLDNTNGVINAINARAANGVAVRVVLNHAVPAATYNQFINAVQKVFSPSGSTYGLMHHKIVLIDANHANPAKPVMWTGSANFTDAQLITDAQNVIIFQDQSIARAATLEFNEMFGNGINGTFGPDKSDNTPKEFVIGGKRVRLYFSPSDGVNLQVKNTLLTAHQSIQFALFTFTRTEQAYAISDAMANGATIVQGMIHDTAQSTNAWNILVNAAGSANIKKYNQSHQLHHKYAIVDAFLTNSDPQVITGSYNWSNAGTLRNDENVVIVHDATIANLYFQEWSQRFKDIGGTVIVGTEPLTAQRAVFTLYPNPASDRFEISYAFPASDLPVFALVDVSGRVVKSWQANASNGSDAVDVQHLPAGMYFLQLRSNSVNQTLRVVKH